MSPRKALSVCSRPGCSELSAGGRCAKCRREADQARGNRHERGYGYDHETRFRAGTLAKDPVCVLCRSAPSTVADHHPLDRRELVARDMDPNDPAHGRGLCASCHGKATQANLGQRGGWNAR